MAFIPKSSNLVAGNWVTALAQAGSDPILSVGLARFKPSLSDAVIIASPGQLSTPQPVPRPLEQRFDHFRQYQFYRAGRPTLEVIYNHYLGDDSDHRSVLSPLGGTYDRIRRNFWSVDLHRLPKLSSNLLSLVLERSIESHEALNYLEGLALRLEADSKTFQRYPIKNDPSKHAMPVDKLFEKLWKFLQDVRKASSSQAPAILSRVEESYRSLRPLLSSIDTSS